MKQVIIGIVVVGLGGMCLVGGCLVSGYNTAVGLDERVTSEWAQVENILQSRFDLIPNLVETVKGITGHESDVYTSIAKSRESYFSAKSVEGKAEATSAMNSALSRLLMLKETYPELRSNENFLKLQDSIEGTERRLAVERKRYNDTVRALNTFVRGLGGKIYASLAGVQQREYFEIDDAARETPKVDFGSDD